MRIANPLYESLPLLYVLGGGVLLYGSYRLHSGTLSLVLMIVGACGAIAGVAIWLRRRDFRAANAEYRSLPGRPDSQDERLR
ncbi:MAG TPA: hypothetical protein VNZ06_14230 [Steroidobacteraceae bacterium]|jgi:hypothetical protein|nr:hypothetical protein [Steroidobacteraceae bacterium]